jgi:hypothetical protein
VYSVFGELNTEEGVRVERRLVWWLRGVSDGKKNGLLMIMMPRRIHT